MITGRILDCLAVNASFLLLYGLPPWPAVRRWRPAAAWPECLLVSLVSGVCLQAVVGALWSRVPGRTAAGALVVSLLIWLTADLATGGRGTAAKGKRDRLPTLQTALLGGTLVLAFVSRSLHPLRHAYLGQSDAYIHLLFIKDVLTAGLLRHPGYPSGYHWTVMAPSLVPGLDPYVTARYAGAFFGVLLTLALYVFWRDETGGRASLFSAFLVAGCPAFDILMKTGVGAFPNQLGLVLLPVLLFACAGDDVRAGATVLNRRVFLLLVAAGLAVCVPLIFINALMVIVLSLVLQRGSGGLFTPRARRVVLLVCLVPALGLPALYVAQSGAGQLAVTARAVTGQAQVHETTPPAIAASLGTLLRDFVRIKRWGLGHPLFNLAGFALLCGFAGFLAVGARGSRTPQRMLCVLGLLAALQTLTGVCEFTAYQRAGWSLLLACALAGGWIAGRAFTFLRPFPAAVSAVYAAVTVCAAAVLWRPPRHFNSLSSAEDEMIAVTRALAACETDRAGTQPAISFERPDRALTDWLPPDPRPPALVVRTSSDSGGYWEIPEAVLPLRSNLAIVYVRGKKKVPLWAAPRCRYVFFLDREEKISVARLGAFGLVNPKGAKLHSEWQYSLYGPNARMRDFIADLDPAAWEVKRRDLAGRAELVSVRSRLSTGAAVRP